MSTSLHQVGNVLYVHTAQSMEAALADDPELDLLGSFTEDGASGKDRMGEIRRGKSRVGGPDKLREVQSSGLTPPLILLSRRYYICVGEKKKIGGRM